MNRLADYLVQVIKHLAGQHDQLRHAGQLGSNDADLEIRRKLAAPELASLEGEIKPLAQRFGSARKKWEMTRNIEEKIKMDRYRAVLMPLVARRDAWNNYAAGGPSAKCDRCGKTNPLALVKTYDTHAGTIRNCCGEPTYEELQKIKTDNEEASGVSGRLTGRSGMDWLKANDPEYKVRKPKSDETLRIDENTTRWKDGDTTVTRTRKRYQDDDDAYLSSDLSGEKDRK